MTRLPHGRMFIGGDEPGPGGGDHTEVATDWPRTLLQVLAAQAEGAGQPVLLTLDNLDAADEQSLTLLGDLVATGDAPTCLVVAAAHGTNRATGKLSPHRSVWSRSPSYREVPLTRLRREQVGALLADSFLRPRAAVDPLAQILLHRSQGNPALVRQLEADARVGDLLLARVPTLAPRVRATLAMAAVLGPRFEGLLVGRALALAPRLVEDHLALLVSVGVLFTVEGAAGDRGEYAFAHPDLPCALYRRLSAPRRRTLHPAAARALSAPDAGASDWPRVVQHYQSAGSAVDDPAERLAVVRFCLPGG